MTTKKRGLGRGLNALLGGAAKSAPTVGVQASAAAAEMWLPRANLSAAKPDAVERYLVARGGTVRRNSRVDLARCSERGWSLAIRSGGDRLQSG